MKTITIRFLFFIMLITLGNHAKSQGVQVTDPDFNIYLYYHYPACIDHYDMTGQIYWDPFCTQFQNEVSLNLNGVPISDFTPLSWFTSLQYLNVSHDYNLSYDGFGYMAGHLSPTLKKLICVKSGQGFNMPGTLQLQGNLPAGLEYLDVDSNYSTSFFCCLPASLKYLQCSTNLMPSIGSLPASLDTLICANNTYSDAGSVWGLGTIATLPPNLKYLDCSNNKLSSLPALPSTLKYLDFSNNIQISYSGNSTYYFGGFTSLPAMPPLLEHFNSSGSIQASAGTLGLTSLPQTLQYLGCRENHLTNLPSLPSNLNYLDCSNNSISCLPVLPASLSYLNILNTNVHCIPNSVNGLQVSLPLCSPVTNVNHCHAFPVVSGYAFYDNNSNGIKDPGENYRANVRVDLSNGLTAFTNNNGYYELSADLGGYTLSVNVPTYYQAVPSSVTYNFSTYDTIVSQLIALQPIVSVDSLRILATAYTPPRPGFSFYYDISYENVGTTVVSPNITFNYDNNRLTYNSSTNAAVIDNGSSLSLAESNFTPGSRRSFTALFTVNNSTPVGTVINGLASITANTFTATDSVHSTVIASLDPNDKEATPQLTTRQVDDGRFVDYLIRFQNTGNAPAVNVVVTDDLNNILQHNSMEMVASSHVCNITKSANNLSFEFLNINLPSKNVDEPGSHGFIRFRVKAQPGTPANTVIPNKANIYFDYNSPVITNTANTLIQANPIPLHLLSFNAFSNAKNEMLLAWSTTNEVNTSSFDIEQSTDGRQFNKIVTVAANGRGDNHYDFTTQLSGSLVYYRLKMIDIDGRYTYSQVLAVKRSSNSDAIVILNNPVKQTLSMVANDPSLKNTSADLINQQGQVVYRFTLTGRIQNIDVSELAAGVYYIKTSQGTIKIIVSR